MQVIERKVGRSEKIKKSMTIIERVKVKKMDIKSNYIDKSLSKIRKFTAKIGSITNIYKKTQEHINNVLGVAR